MVKFALTDFYASAVLAAGARRQRRPAEAWERRQKRHRAAAGRITHAGLSGHVTSALA